MSAPALDLDDSAAPRDGGDRWCEEMALVDCDDPCDFAFDPNTCAFPDRCLMPEPHLRIECHDAKMIEEHNAEMAMLDEAPAPPEAPPASDHPLEWTETWDDLNNSTWEAASALHDEGSPFMWRLKQALRYNRIFWDDASDRELTDGEATYWTTLAEAQAGCQYANDAIRAECGSEE